MPITILAAYRSPQTNINIFLSELSTIMTSGSIQKNCIWVGDINIDILEKNISLITENYLNILSSNGFSSQICTHTRVGYDTSSCIDHIFSRNVNLISAVIKTSITDHYTIIGSLINSQANNKHLDDYLNLITYIDYNKAVKLLSCIQWDGLFETNNTNTAINIFNNNILETINNCIVSKSQSNRKNFKIKPWITNGLVTSIKNRDKLNMKIKRDTSNHKLINYYKAYRNKLTILIRKAKEQYYINKIEICKGNGREIWKVINELSGRKIKSTGLPINEIIQDVYPTSTPKDYLNIVNSYFATTGNRLVDNNFPNITNNIQSNFGTNTNNKSSLSSIFKLKTIGSYEVKNILNNLNNNSAPGVDGYTALFFKQIGDNVILPIVHIINCSITNSTVPDELKVARIVPIHKKGDKTDFTNYRPISIVGILAKILEKIIKNQLLEYLEREKIIFTGQYGFRKKLGTEDALIDINNYLHSKRDTKKKILISFLDLEKAFDSISRQLLLNKLKELGFDDNALKWFTSYLSNRQQLTTIGPHHSDHCYVKDYGVTQGTSLGPILFLIYINSIPASLLKGKLFMFADDIALVNFEDNWEKLKHTVEIDLRHIYDWMEKNLLSLNINKSVCMPIVTIRSQLPVGYKFIIHKCGTGMTNCSCKPIKMVLSFKYLGVTMDYNLKWSEHINNIKNKMRSLTVLFYKIRFLDKSIIRQIYMALCNSILLYGITCWGGTNRTDINTLHTTQKMIVKVAFSLPLKFPSEELFKHTNILSVYKLYIRQILVKSIQNHTLNATEIIDRRTGKYIKPSYTLLTSSRNSPNYMGKTIFNNLNNEVKSLIKSLCESHSNNTNDIINIINKNQIKKAINKIVSDLDDNVCINKITKSQYV